MPREPGAWINDRYNSDYSRRQSANDDAYEAQERAASRRRALRMVTPYPFVETDAAIESEWDRLRQEQDR